MKKHGPVGMALIASALAAMGCNLLLDFESRQCVSDQECTRFGGRVACDRAQGLCMPMPAQLDAALASSSTHDGGPSDASMSADGEVDAAGADSGGPSSGHVCTDPHKPLVRIEGDITASDLLSCDKDYLLVGIVYLKPGVSLTIEKGTTIFGDVATKGTLVVQPGGRLYAVGTADEPVVFTSPRAPEQRAPGDWGGVILLGRAPVNAANPTIEGITTGGEYGGTDEEDSSGSLSYVRIEYSGTKLGPNNEINGLTLGGVGRRTVLEHIQVRQTADDCFEFFGGTVNAKYLVCQYNGDDGFDWDNGYRGKLQFLVLQEDPSVADETNGFEGDNDATGSANRPTSEPTIYNATLCGKNVDVDREQYGMLLRRGTRAHIFNTIVDGFEAGIDVRDAPLTLVDVSNSVFFGNLAANVAYVEDAMVPGPRANDDNGFDEIDFIMSATRANSVAPPGLRNCFDARDITALAPAKAITGNAATPPGDGFFDVTAAYVGAFRDAASVWVQGRWVVWSEK